MVHTPETVTYLTPWDTLTKIHLLCSTRWRRAGFFPLVFFLCLLLLLMTSNHSGPSSRCLLMSTIRRDRTKQDQAYLCKMRPLLATEPTIDLRLQKRGCKPGYLPPVNWKLNPTPLGSSIMNYGATESAVSITPPSYICSNEFKPLLNCDSTCTIKGGWAEVLFRHCGKYKTACVAAGSYQLCL